MSRVRPVDGPWLYAPPPPPPTPLPTNPTNTPNPPGFRPPSQSHLPPNDLELYNIRNDGWCLITLALILLSFTNAVPLSAPPAALHSADTPRALTASGKNAALPYAKAVVAATVFHHVTTGLGAWQHYKLDSHYNVSMGIGVWGNVWLAVTGLVTLAVLVCGWGEGERVEEVVAGRKDK